MNRVCCLIWAASLSWLCAANAHAQTISDAFTDGDLTVGPTWSGTLGQFQHQQGQLRLNGPTGQSGVAYLSTPFVRNLSAAATTWELLVQLDALLNDDRQIRFYLTSSQALLSAGPLDGYYLQFGRTGGTGRIELIRQVGNARTVVMQGTAGRTDAYPTLRVRVTRSAGTTATWQLAVDPTGGRDFAVEATQTETGLFSSAFAGVVVRYTSGSTRSFAIDDFFAGTAVPDVTGPLLRSAEAESAATVLARFDETVSASQVAANYSIVGVDAALTAVRDVSNRGAVRLTFAGGLPVGAARQLQATNVADALGNVATSETSVIWWNARAPGPGELVFSEVMPDPTPTKGLPEVEYVELYNRSGRNLDLGGCTLADATLATLPLPKLVLPSGQRLLLVGTPDLAAYSSVTNKAGFPAPDSWINNEGDSLVLRNGGGQVVTELVWATTSYAAGERAEEGRSLERSNVTSPCPDPRLFRASSDPRGGTPGEANSQEGPLTDTAPPQLLTWGTVSGSEVLLTFDAPLDTASAETLANYTVQYASGGPVAPVLVVLERADRVRVLLPAALDPAVVTVLTITGLADCYGNALRSSIEIRLVLLRPPTVGEVRINELLATPATGGSRYVEFISAAGVGIDLKGCRVARVRASDTSRTEVSATASVPLLPGEVVAITDDVGDVKARFSPPATASIREAATLPAVDAEGDVVALLAPDGRELDRIEYRPSLHSRVLNELAGVALERTSAAAPSSEATTWRSGAATTRYGTPGYPNARTTGAGAVGLRLQRETFTPNGDGQDDVLVCTVEGDHPDALLTLEIADLQGRVRRQLARRLLLPTAGELVWDGRDAAGTLLPPGIYVVVARLSTGGKEEIERLPCVLARAP